MRDKLPRNITARVIESDTSGEIYYFLEDSRGFELRQHGRQHAKLAANLVAKNDVNLAFTAKISPSSH
ncbi:hypothetical protein TNCV_676571 [Trichonephila clavipes]|nr:hypothetical protein TNCV_676571 [Trichonephila clavipes]